MVNKKQLPIGIIGMGSMGSFVARAVLSGKVPGVKLFAVADIKPLPDDLLRELQAHSVSVVDSFSSLLDFPIKLAVECANQTVVRECAESFIRKGIDLLIMSVGALVQGAFFRDLAEEAEAKGVRIYVPSGAVGAIDALQAAKLHGLDEVTLTTRKPPRSLGKMEGVDLEGLQEPRVIFEGPAKEAVVKFPQNVNVAATISLAGLGPDKTLVRVVADPFINQNIHEIQARGSFGSFEIRLVNLPNPENPKTSLLACLSVVSLLKKIPGTVQIGG
ncbi:MAG: aspartate dehydrogenase [Deltaproteobacteria bacterium]|nr:aspartate dehydrogenase [Deltaproteobacteria bacterium]